ncbi:MAG: DNA polymerase IV [bacterium]
MFICIDLDAFFVSVERALNPALRAKPVVVGGLPGERGVVASASYEARKFGIRSGMSISRAHRLCPYAIFLKPNFSKYELFSERFKQILYRYSPDVEMVSIDEAFVDIRGTERLFGPPINLAQEIKKDINETLNLPCSVGIARTKPIAKIACDESKPDGLLFVAPDDEKDFLSPLSVDVLPGIGPKTYEILKNLNITTVAQFFNAPDWILETALGSSYRAIKYFVSGGDYKILHSIKSISQETTLTEDTKNSELISAIFYNLVEYVCQRLRERNMNARLCTIKLRFSDFKTISRRVNLFPATNAQQKVYEFCLPVLMEMLKENKRVRLVGISFSELELSGLQSSIFFKEETRLIKLNYALDKTRMKFGNNAIFSAKTLILYKSQLHNKSV